MITCTNARNSRLGQDGVYLVADLLAIDKPEVMPLTGDGIEGMEDAERLDAGSRLTVLSDGGSDWVLGQDGSWYEQKTGGGGGEGDTGASTYTPAITNEALWDYYRPADWPVLPEPVSDDEITYLVDTTISGGTCKMRAYKGYYKLRIEILRRDGDKLITLDDYTYVNPGYTARFPFPESPIEIVDAMDVVASLGVTERYLIVRYTFAPNPNNAWISVDPEDTTAAVEVSIKAKTVRTTSNSIGAGSIVRPTARLATVYALAKGVQGWPTSLVALRVQFDPAEEVNIGSCDGLQAIASASGGRIVLSALPALKYVSEIVSGEAPYIANTGLAYIACLRITRKNTHWDSSVNFSGNPNLIYCPDLDCAGLRDIRDSADRPKRSPLKGAFDGCVALARVCLRNLGVLDETVDAFGETATLSVPMDLGLAGTADAPRALKSILMPSEATSWTGADLDLSYNQLDHDALRALVISLPHITEQRTITITGNPGAADTPEDIISGALRKNWVLAGVTASEAVG